MTSGSMQIWVTYLVIVVEFQRFADIKLCGSQVFHSLVQLEGLTHVHVTERDVDVRTEI